MKITKVSKWSGKERTREIDITEDQLKQWQDGELIQNAMPHLSPDDREFMISGMDTEEWAAYCKEWESLWPEYKDE